MKSFIQFVIVAAIVVSAASMSFAGFISSSTVAMSATVSGVNSMTVTTPLGAIAFGTLGSGGAAYSTKATQYVQIAVNNNAASWKVRTWTNNYGSQPSTTTWGFQYGGLKGAVNGDKISMGWQASSATAAGINLVAGDPATSASNGWTYLKDIKDVWDNVIVPHNDFATSDAAGYTTVAYGNGTYTNINVPNAVGGSRALTNRTDSFYLYTEADLSVASADTYTGTLVIDLTNF